MSVGKDSEAQLRPNSMEEDRSSPLYLTLPHANSCTSGHTDFSESTEEIAPLTEDEKKQRLEELRKALAEKRAKQAIIDKEEQKKNEVQPTNPFMKGIC
jgi:ribosomal protein L29